MSEQEFENWLALLSGLLKLSPEQRQNISDELRSHLEERMEDLIDAGSSREEAIAAALAEFGDTAALAHHFTSIAHQKRRRLMRYTYGTIAAVTCAILVLAAFWPGPQAPMIEKGNAQPEPESIAGATPKEKEISFAESRKQIEANLAKPIPDIAFQQMPLREVLEELREQTGVTFYMDAVSLAEYGVEPNSPIDVDVVADTMSYKTLLEEFILGRLELGFAIRDNYVMVGGQDAIKDSKTEVVVYNCRDLLMSTPPAGPQKVPGGEAEKSAAAGNDSAATVLKQFGGVPPGGIFAGADPKVSAAAEQQLIQVISNTVASGTWNVAGNVYPANMTVGSIDAINGLIVINHTREVHAQVKDLLKLLREAKDEHGLDGTIFSYPRTNFGGLSAPGGIGGGGFGGGGGFY